MYNPNVNYGKGNVPAHSDRKARQAREKAKIGGQDAPQRGTPVKGTGVPKKGK